MVRLGLCAMGMGILARSVTVHGQNSSSSAEPDVVQVTAMDTGSFHTVVIIRDTGVNVVKDWGANGKGQLGLNDTKDRGDNDGNVGGLLPEVYLGDGLEAVDVTAGLRHTAAILNDGTIRGWGYNGKGQLGIGNIRNVGDGPNDMGNNMTVTNLGSTTPVSISAGGWHTCIITEDNKLKCWGYNQWGELGLGDKNDRGDEPGEMGDNLPFVDLGDNVEVAQISLGDWHTCVLLTDGNVVCFGKNYAGQLGNSNAIIWGDGSGEMGNSLPRVYLGNKKATMVACGEEHSCAALEDGEVRCWGLGASGQLGQGNRLSVGDDPNEMYNLFGIDLGSSGAPVQLAAGGNHTCVLFEDSSVKCWGDNSFGQLGQGDTFNRGIAPGQMGDGLLPVSLNPSWTVKSISAGYYHTCVLVDVVDSLGVVTESVACWGANFKGQMGLGISETEHIGDESDEMGENLKTANVAGNIVEEPDSEKWYEKLWFYITIGIVGGLLCICFICLCVRSHGDNSGRGSYPAVRKKTPESPSDMEANNVSKTYAAAGGAASRRAPASSTRPAATGTEADSETVAGSPSAEGVSAAAPEARSGGAKNGSKA